MRFSTIVLAGGIMCVASCACAQLTRSPWFDLGRGPAGRVLLDTSSIRTDSVGLRIRLRFADPEQVGVRVPRESYTRQADIRSELDTYIDCQGGRVWEKAVTTLNAQGDSVYGFRLPDSTWSVAARRQTAQLFFELACAGLRAIGKL